MLFGGNMSNCNFFIHCPYGKKCLKGVYCENNKDKSIQHSFRQAKKSLKNRGNKKKKPNR